MSRSLNDHDEMKLVLGLGNPGKKYTHTRHNLGFLILDELQGALDLLQFSKEKKLHADVTQGAGVILAKPTTFMNDSGVALDLLCLQYKLEASDIVVVHDDLDIPFGNLKLHKSGNPAGHNGLRSISLFIDLATINRLRCGIAGTERGAIPGEKYVLSNFNASEKNALEQFVARGSAAILSALTDGFEKAAQLYNQKQNNESKL